MDISYILNQLGENREDYFNAVSPPIIQTSNFAFPDVSSFRSAIEKEKEVSCYTRGLNPTVDILRQKLAALEGSEDSLVFASGCAAISAAVLSVVGAGDHVVCVKSPYSWTNKLMTEFLPKYGISSTMIDGTNTENFSNSIQPNTKLFYLESPNSFTFELQDIEAVCKIAKKHGITTIIDNSYSSPLNQHPVSLGCDIVVHSASKYLGGHSDIVAGVICANQQRIDKIFANEFMMLGGIISPNDAWLMLRGLRTLEIRMDRITQTTAKIIEFLEQEEKVEKIFYPFSKSFPQYELACKQMKKGAGLFTIKLKANNIEEVETFCNSLKRFLLACSWGGYESLVFPACIFHNNNNETTISKIPFDMIRFYIGLEDADVLIEDLKQGLSSPALLSEKEGRKK